MAGIRVKLISGSQSATGSFTKLLYSGSGTICDRIDFGNLKDPYDGGTYNTVTDLQALNHGTYLDGPIASFHVKDESGAVLAYYNDGTLKNVQ
jgi:hypothetical protein